MKRGLIVLGVILALLGITSPGSAQGDGLNLPTELYILLNAGEVQRYGIGRAGVTTVTPDGVFVLDFSVAPDGNWLAYRTESGVYLLDMTAPDAEPVQVEDDRANFPPLRQGGQTVTWSPQGDALAYTTEYGARVAFEVQQGTPRFVDIPVSPLKHLSWSPDGGYLAAEAEQNVWWVYRRTPDGMPLTSAIPSSYGADWLDEGRLVFAPADGGLLLMNLNEANAQSTLRPADQVYRRPHVRPDGDIVAFATREASSDGTLIQGLYQRMTFDGTSASVVESGDAPVDLQGLRWGPGGELLIALSGGAISLVRPLSGEGFTLPASNVVAYSWGPPQPEGVRGIATGAGLYFRAADTFGVTQVWRLPGDGADRAQVTQAEFDVTAFAQDSARNRLAYVSGGTLWLLPLDTTDAAPRELARVNESVDGLHFNANGSALVYATSSQVDGGIWRVEVPQSITDLPAPEATPETTLEPGEATPEARPRGILPATTRLLADTDDARYRAPHFAPNVNAILVVVQSDDGSTYAVYDPTAEALLSLGDYAGARWLRDGRVLAWGGSQVVTIDTGQEPVTPQPVITLEGRRILDARVSAGTVRMVVEETVEAGPVHNAVLSVPLGGGTPQAAGSLGYVVNPRVAPDGNFVASLNRPGGTLLVSNLQNGTQTALESPSGVLAFRWQAAFN